MKLPIALLVCGAALVSPRISHASQADAMPPVSDAVPAEPEITALPRVVNFVHAAYPQQAFKTRQTAEVLLEFDISVTGAVENISVVTPSKYPGIGFEEAATLAVNQFQFSPAMTTAGAIAVRIQYLYVFKPPIQAIAKQVSVRGKVIERTSQKPVGDLAVIVFTGEGSDSKGFEMRTAPDGTFEFYNLSGTAWTALVENPRYETYKRSFALAGTATTELSIALDRRTSNPYDVLVEERKQKEAIGQLSISQEELKIVPGTYGTTVNVSRGASSANIQRALGADALDFKNPAAARGKIKITDLLRIITQNPLQDVLDGARAILNKGRGVTIDAKIQNPSGIMIRGSDVNDSRMSINGLDIPSIYHVGGLHYTVPNEMIERIDFYAGNFPVRFGRSTGGVADLNLKNLAPERFGGFLDVNTLSSATMLQSPLGPSGGIAVGGRWNYQDQVLNAVIPEDQLVTFASIPSYYDGEVLANYTLADKHHLRLFATHKSDKVNPMPNFFGRTDRIEAEGAVDPSTLEVETETDFGLLEYAWDGRVLRNQFSLGYYQNDEFQPTFDSKLTSYQLREGVDWRVHHAITVRAGIDYLQQIFEGKVEPRVSIDPSNPFAFLAPELFNTIRIERRTAHYPAAYLDGEFRMMDRLVVVPGMRVDHFGRADQTTADPRINASLKVAEPVSLLAAAAIVHREPNVDELSENFGNPLLSVEKAIQYEAGFRVTPARSLRIEATGFVKQLSNLAAPSNATFATQEEFKPVEYKSRVYENTGEGRIYGTELEVAYAKPGRYFASANYTYSISKFRDLSRDPLELAPSDQTHVLSLRGGLFLPARWSLGFEWNLSSGLPTYPIQSVAYNAQFNAYTANYGEFGDARLPVTHQLDIRVEKQFILDVVALTAYLDVRNVYNRANAQSNIYSQDFGSYTAQSGLPILPSLGIRADF